MVGGSPGPRSWAVSAMHRRGFSLAMCRCVKRKRKGEKPQKHTPKHHWHVWSGGLHRAPVPGAAGEGTAAKGQGGRAVKTGQLQGNPSPESSAGSTPSCGYQGLAVAPAPRVFPRPPCVPRLFQEEDGAPAGGEASRAAGPSCHVPPSPATAAGVPIRARQGAPPGQEPPGSAAEGGPPSPDRPPPPPASKGRW